MTDKLEADIRQRLVVFPASWIDEAVAAAREVPDADTTAAAVAGVINARLALMEHAERAAVWAAYLADRAAAHARDDAFMALVVSDTVQ